MRLLSYNIRNGGTGREGPIANVIGACDPDLVVLQEATDPAVVASLARQTAMREWGTKPRESLGFLARRPVRRAEWHRPRLSRHAFLEILPATAETAVYGVHLSAVHSAWTERRRAMELRALIRSVRQRRHPCHVLVGDFNTLAPGELLDVTKLPRRLRALVWLSGGRIRWRTIQIVLDEGYVDAFRRLQPSVAGLTFPTWDPHVRLDYLFAPADCAAHVLACEVVERGEVRTASDHFPLLSHIEAHDAVSAESRPASS